MRPGARIRSAIDVLDDVIVRHRPASVALADWGKSSRFAGSGDRAAVGNLVYDALRRKLSIAARMQSDTARALILGAAGRALALAPEAIAAAADGSAHTIEPLSADELAGLSRPVPEDAPDWVRGDFAEWLAPSLGRVFAGRVVEEGAALTQRAPVDLRVNTLKTTRDKVLKALVAAKPAATALSSVGVRLRAPEGPGRQPNVEAEPAHGKGWFEVQDEGSQIAALLAGATPRSQALDLCAGAGGKTLALAAAMENTGQLYAFDRDKIRLRPIFERLKRAGVRNTQVLQPGDTTALNALGARFDVVLIDAPCTGSGVWRRRPDSKWRLKPQDVPERQSEQKDLLDLAAPLVKPGGRLVFVTCSILPEEGHDQIAAFLARHDAFTPILTKAAWHEAGLPGEAPPSANGRGDSLLLTPARHDTDGFFIAILRRTGTGDA
ncbi:MAG: RsmB/NOP family class I SAM-dependent RNA methyltransferase [Hyphomicrobiaceae bacterium]